MQGNCACKRNDQFFFSVKNAMKSCGWWDQSLRISIPHLTLSLHCSTQSRRYVGRPEEGERSAEVTGESVEVKGLRVHTGLDLLRLLPKVTSIHVNNQKSFMFWSHLMYLCPSPNSRMPSCYPYLHFVSISVLFFY